MEGQSEENGESVVRSVMETTAAVSLTSFDEDAFWGGLFLLLYLTVCCIAASYAAASERDAPLPTRVVVYHARAENSQPWHLPSQQQPPIYSP